MPAVNLFTVRNRRGEEIGLAFYPSKKTKEALIADLLQKDEEGLVMWVRGMAFVRLDNKWLPMVSADRSYLERPEDFMGVLEEGKLRFASGWRQSKWKSLWWLLKWKWKRGVGFFEQPTMVKALAGEYKKYDPLSLGD